MKKFILTNKIYFSILSTFSFFLLVYSFKKNNINDFEIIFLSSFLVLLIFTLNFVFIIREQIHYYPINVFINLYILICILFFIYNFNYIHNNTYPGLFRANYILHFLDINTFTNLFKDSIKILILTILFFNLGFFLIYKIFKEKKFNFFPDLDEIQFIRLNFFLILIKLIFLIFAINKAELINPINLLILLISFYSIIFFKKNKLLNFFIIILLFSENTILTFAIYKNIIVLVVCFIIYYNLKKQISIIIISLLVLWIFLGQPLKSNYRSNFQTMTTLNIQIQESKGLSEEEINKMVKEAEKRQEDINPRSLILRLTEPIVSLMRILEVEKIKKKEIKKDTISILKYALVPRILYPDKPKQDFSAWYTGYFFTVYQEAPKTIGLVTYNIFWPSDFYINYKYYGSTLFAFIVGVILSFFSLVLTSYKSSNIHYLYGLSIMSGLTFPDYNLSLMLSPIFLQVIILYILLKILIYIIKR